MKARIEISAQFGGEDAASALMPSFNALKAASEKFEISNFPLSDLTFILRVDGSVTEYGSTGLGEYEISKKESFIAIDLGIPINKWNSADNFICEEIEKVSEFLNAINHPILKDFNAGPFRKELQRFIARFKSEREKCVKREK